MLNECDIELVRLIRFAISYLEKFQDTFQSKEVRREYLKILDKIVEFLGNKNGDDFNEKFFKYLYEEYYSIVKKTDKTEEWKTEHLREQFSMILIRQIPQYRDELYEENIFGKISEYMVLDTMEEYSKKIPFYYKNCLLEEDWETFETIMEFIRGELVRYHLNIAYVKKITSFMAEFNEKGVFPLDLQFLNRYLDTAVSEMILVQTKLFSNANTVQQKNFGFDYLRYNISENSKNKEVNKLLGEIRKKIKVAKDKCKKMEKIRNGMIAHYDIKLIQKETIDTVSIEDLEELYEISVDLLETLSLHYFERKDSAFLEMMNKHGFKKAVVENPIFEPKLTSDLDEYLNILRERFIDKIQIV